LPSLLQGWPDVDEQLVLATQKAVHGKALRDEHVITRADSLPIEVDIREAIKALKDEFRVIIGALFSSETSEIPNMGALKGPQRSDVHAVKWLTDDPRGLQIQLKIAGHSTGIGLIPGSPQFHTRAQLNGRRL
jgi:hypothetical protein